MPVLLAVPAKAPQPVAVFHSSGPGMLWSQGEFSLTSFPQLTRIFAVENEGR